MQTGEADGQGSDGTRTVQTDPDERPRGARRERGGIEQDSGTIDKKPKRLFLNLCSSASFVF